MGIYPLTENSTPQTLEEQMSKQENDIYSCFMRKQQRKKIY